MSPCDKARQQQWEGNSPLTGRNLQSQAQGGAEPSAAASWGQEEKVRRKAVDEIQRFMMITY